MTFSQKPVVSPDHVSTEITTPKNNWDEIIWKPGGLWSHFDCSNCSNSIFLEQLLLRATLTCGVCGTPAGERTRTCYTLTEWNSREHKVSNNEDWVTYWSQQDAAAGGAALSAQDGMLWGGYWLNQGPEVREGDVLTVSDTHLPQDVVSSHLPRKENTENTAVVLLRSDSHLHPSAYYWWRHPVIFFYFFLSMEKHK